MYIKIAKLHKYHYSIYKQLDVFNFDIYLRHVYYYLFLNIETVFQYVNIISIQDLKRMLI